MATEKRLIEIPEDGIVRIPLMRGESLVGERRIDLSFLPTVDVVEVVHGRWYSGCVCSECGEDLSSWADAYYETNYCPNCGAKMDGDGNA